MKDDGLVIEAFSASMRAVGLSDSEIDSAMPFVHRTMGMPKAVVFAEVLGGQDRVGEALESFDAAIIASLSAGRVQEIPGASVTLADLRSRGVKICLTTGFTAAVQEAMVSHLGWTEAVDLSLAPGEGVRGRPYPDLVLTAIVKLGVDDVRLVAVAGDTANDLWTGWRAGAGIVAGVLTGCHGRAELESAPHTDIVESVTGLPPLVERFPGVPGPPGR